MAYGDSSKGGGKDSQQQEQTAQQINAPTNPTVDPTVTKLLTGVQSEIDKGPNPFAESTYAGVGDTTKNAWAMGKTSAANPWFNTGVDNALKFSGNLAGGSGPSLTEQNMLDTANGKFIGQSDPGYDTIRRKLSNDVLTSTNAAFNGSGLFGSDNNQKEAAAGLTDSLGALDLGQYNDSLDRRNAALAAIEGTRQTGVNNAFSAAQMLPGLYTAGQMPAAQLAGIGAAEDADKQAALMGRYDLNERLDNAKSDRLAKLGGVLSGGASASGTSATTYEPQQPWWAGPLGFGAQVLGSALRV
jgi:hypothetical protein